MPAPPPFLRARRPLVPAHIILQLPPGHPLCFSHARCSLRRIHSSDSCKMPRTRRMNLSPYPRRSQVQTFHLRVSCTSTCICPPCRSQLPLADGSFVETSSGAVARQLKRRYNQYLGVGRDVRSPYAITAFVNQQSKQMYPPHRPLPSHVCLSTPSYQAPSSGPLCQARRLSPTLCIPHPPPGTCTRRVPFPTASLARMSHPSSPPRIFQDIHMRTVYPVWTCLHHLPLLP